MLDNETLLFKYNIDEQGNPVSIKVEKEVKQVSINGTIQMEFIPDEFNGIGVLNESNQPMYEVFNKDEIIENTYYVDYSSGTMYFHESQFGKVKIYNYYNKGLQLIGASRIYDENSVDGEVVIKTLQYIIDEGRKCLELIKSLGDAVLIINKLDQDIKTGTILHENLTNDIEMGTPLDASLKSNISKGDTLLPQLVSANDTATQKKQALDTSITQATNTNEVLTNTNQSATQTNLTLQQTIATASDGISKINATGNKSLVIGASSFVNNEYTWTHSMNADNLIVNFIDSDTNEPLMQDYKIIDKNNILIRNSAEHPNIKIVLSASYYQGNAVAGHSVEDFAGDSISTGAKKVRLRDTDGTIKNVITDSDSVYMTDGTTKLTKKINDINSSLEQKAQKTEVRFKNILIDTNDITDTLKQQISGNAPIMQTVGDRIVSPLKTTFIERGINLFNKATITNGYIDYTNGKAVSSSDGLYCSDYILLDNSTEYSHNNFLRNQHFAFYDINKNYISNSVNTLTNPFTTPSNAKYIRATILDSNQGALNNANNGIIVKGNSATTTGYIPYSEKIIKDILPVTETDMIKDKAITLEKIGFTYNETGKNLIDISKATSEKYVIHSNGNLGNWSGCKATDFIEIEPNTEYSYNSGVKNQHFAFYDIDKVFIESSYTSSNSLTNPFTTPSNAVYLRLTNPPNTGLPQLEKGKISTDYEAFKGKKVINKDVLPKEALEGGISVVKEEKVFINLPNKIYAIENERMVIYFENIMLDWQNYNIQVVCSKGLHYSDRYEITPTSSDLGDINLTVKVFDKQNKLLKEKNCILTVNANSVANTNKTCMFLGDSTIRAEKITSRVLTKSTADVLKLNLVGTLGYGTNKYEGRGGWNAKMWCTWYQEDTFYGANPFYNPTTKIFDVNYYKANQNLTSLDCIIIHLGINDNMSFLSDDLQDAEIINITSYYNKMITSFKSAFPNIKIGIGMTIPPNTNQDTFTPTFKCNLTSWRCKRNNVRWVEKMIAEFDNRDSENIYLIPSHTSLSKENYKDHVHCLDNGYYEIGDNYFYWLKNVFK